MTFQEWEIEDHPVFTMSQQLKQELQKESKQFYKNLL